MTINNFTSGVNTSFSTELNQNFAYVGYLDIYTGTDLDFSIGASSSGSKTKSFSVAGSDVSFGDYIELGFNGYTHMASASSGDAFLRIGIEESVNSTTVVSTDDSLINASSNGNRNTCFGFNFFHTVSTDDVANGMQFDVTFNYSTGTGSTARFKNNGTYIRKITLP